MASPNRETGTQLDSLQYMVFKNFETMDTQAERWGLAPNRLAWLENLQIVNPNKLQCVPGPSPSIATITPTIYRKYFASYLGGDFLIEFATDGSAYQVNVATGSVVTIAPAGTFSNPDVTTWQQQRILIADPSAGYATWDGTIFVKSGGVSPRIVITNGGSGYFNAPTVTISGGSGFGATATASVLGGFVSAIQLTNQGSGYKPGDVLTVTFGGPGTGATASAIVWPSFPSFSFNTIAIAFGRVWLAGGTVLQFLGTQGFDDANTGNAAGFQQITDADLVHRITALRNLNNFLYIFGDGSIKQIGTITVAGQATIFAITTLSSDTGTVFPRTIQSYNRVVTFCNWEGVWAIYGATVARISDELDSIFGDPNINNSLIDFTQEPQAIVCTISSKRCYALMVRYLDPIKGPRTIFLTRDGKRWFVVSQGNSIVAVAVAVLNGKLKPFASSGHDVSPILNDRSVPVTILIQSALDAQNKEMMLKRHLRLGITQFGVNPGAGITFTTDTENGSGETGTYTFGFPIVWLNNLGQVVTWLNATGGVVTFVSGGFLWQEEEGAGSGIYLGFSLSGTVAGFRFSNVVIEYEDAVRMRSRNR